MMCRTWWIVAEELSNVLHKLMKLCPSASFVGSAQVYLVFDLVVKPACFVVAFLF